MNINVVYGKGKDADHIVVLGFEVVPESRGYDMEEWNKFSDDDKKAGKCPSVGNGLVLVDPKKDEPATQDVLWTFSVTWTESTTIKWTERWDVYLKNTGNQIHWISIVNSLMIVLFLTGMFLL